MLYWEYACVWCVWCVTLCQAPVCLSALHMRVGHVEKVSEIELETLMKPEELTKHHQTLSSGVGSEDECICTCMCTIWLFEIIIIYWILHNLVTSWTLLCYITSVTHSWILFAKLGHSLNTLYTCISNTCALCISKACALLVCGVTFW